jgi:hypothetical protein
MEVVPWTVISATSALCGEIGWSNVTGVHANGPCLCVDLSITATGSGNVSIRCSSSGLVCTNEWPLQPDLPKIPSSDKHISETAARIRQQVKCAQPRELQEWSEHTVLCLKAMHALNELLIWRNITSVAKHVATIGYNAHSTVQSRVSQQSIRVAVSDQCTVTLQWAHPARVLLRECGISSSNLQPAEVTGLPTGSAYTPHNSWKLTAVSLSLAQCYAVLDAASCVRPSPAKRRRGGSHVDGHSGTIQSRLPLSPPLLDDGAEFAIALQSPLQPLLDFWGPPAESEYWQARAQAFLGEHPHAWSQFSSSGAALCAVLGIRPSREQEHAGGGQEHAGGVPAAVGMGTGSIQAACSSAPQQGGSSSSEGRTGLPLGGAEPAPPADTRVECAVCWGLEPPVEGEGSTEHGTHMEPELV